jgi:hypothetical protein
MQTTKCVLNAINRALDSRMDVRLVIQLAIRLDVQGVIQLVIRLAIHLDNHRGRLLPFSTGFESRGCTHFVTKFGRMIRGVFCFGL